MLLVQVALASRSGESGTEADANLVLDSLWAHAGHQHCLEHVRTRTAPHGIDLVLFIRADSRDSARGKARSLLSQALRSSLAARYTPVLHPVVTDPGTA